MEKKKSGSILEFAEPETKLHGATDEPLPELPADNSEAVAWEPTTPVVVERPQESSIFQTIAEDTRLLHAALEHQDISKWLDRVTRKMVDLLDPICSDRYYQFCEQHDAPVAQVLFSMLRRACELNDFSYFPDSYWDESMERAGKAIFCQNCAQEIPRARQGQQYCCSMCSAYARGSKSPLVLFGHHSEGCVLHEEKWVREPMSTAA